MRITESQLRRIIRQEVARTIFENRRAPAQRLLSRASRTSRRLYESDEPDLTVDITVDTDEGKKEEINFAGSDRSTYAPIILRAVEWARQQKTSEAVIDLKNALDPRNFVDGFGFSDDGYEKFRTIMEKYSDFMGDPDNQDELKNADDAMKKLVRANNKELWGSNTWD